MPTLGEAWWSLANLKTVRFAESDIAAMRAVLDRPDLKDSDRFHLQFALGKALHDASRPDEAFAQYAAGNALRRTYHPFRSGEISSLVDRSIETFTADVMIRSGGCQAADPIFIVGMPRGLCTNIHIVPGRPRTIGLRLGMKF